MKKKEQKGVYRTIEKEIINSDTGEVLQFEDFNLQNNP